MSAEAVIRTRLGGLAGLTPGISELIEIAVYGAGAGMFGVADVPEVPALLPEGDFAAWEAPYRELERLLLSSGAWRAFYAERGEYPVKPVCPAWCSLGDHAVEEPPEAMIIHGRYFDGNLGITAAQTQAGTTAPLLSVALPSGDELETMTAEQARDYAHALLAAAELFEELTR